MNNRICNFETLITAESQRQTIIYYFGYQDTTVVFVPSYPPNKSVFLVFVIYGIRGGKDDDDDD